MAPPLNPRFTHLHPAHARARRAAQGASRKSGNRCERLLQALLEGAGLEIDPGAGSLPGRPDLVVPALRLAIFVD